MNFKQTEQKIFGGSSIIKLTSDKFEISASRHGVSFQGESPIFSTTPEFNTLAEAIARAWKWHKKLKADNVQMESN